MLVHGKLQPMGRFRIVPLYAFSKQVRLSEIALGGRTILFGRQPVPFNALFKIQIHAPHSRIAHPHVALAFAQILVRGASEPF